MKRLLLTTLVFAAFVTAPTVTYGDDYTLAPRPWGGSNGVNQPTGFEIRGPVHYELKNGRVVPFDLRATGDFDFWKRYQLYLPGGGGVQETPQP